MFHSYRWQVMTSVIAVIFLTLLLIPSAPIRASVSDADVFSSPLQQSNVNSDGVKTYSEALVGQVQRLNPLFANLNPVDRDITSLIFEGLTRINSYGEPIGALATSWIISNDGLEYVFTLREDVLWQDGIPFTADDVIFTMELLRDLNFAGDSELSRFWRTVEVQKLSDYLVRFRLTQPLATFLENARIGILPEHALRGTSASALASHPFNLTPIGTGPYQLEALRADQNGAIRMVDLRVAPVYARRLDGQTGYDIQRIRFQLYNTYEAVLNALSTGEVDGFASRTLADRESLLRTARLANLQIVNGITPTVGTLIFNWTDDNRPYFREPRIRQALQYALNPTTLVELNMLNMAVPANSPILPTSWAYDSNLGSLTLNMGQARQTLDSVRIQDPTPQPDEEAVATETATGGPTPEPVLFTFSILVMDDPMLTRVADAIAVQWMQLGLGVSVDVVASDEFTARLETTQFDVALAELTIEGTADPDVYAFWHQGQYPDGKNFGGANDRVISQLLEKARRDAYGINRIQDYRTFQREFRSRAIGIPLYNPLFTYVHSPRVDNVSVGHLGLISDRFVNVKDWIIID